VIAIVDYGMGNLRSAEKGFEKAGVEDVFVTPDRERVREADGIVLPGVGAFRDAMANLERTGMRDVVLERVAEGTPLLGICLGMQLLASMSFENGEHDGLGLIPGVCERLPSDVKVPHMGWNTVAYPQASPLFEGVPEDSAFYFVHSYHLRPESAAHVIGRTEYGVSFASAVAKDGVYGLQFHPEKSSETGLRILADYGRIVQRQETS
jgi:glutamine amidotransferase